MAAAYLSEFSSRAAASPSCSTVPFSSTRCWNTTTFRAAKNSCFCKPRSTVMAHTPCLIMAGTLPGTQRCFPGREAVPLHSLAVCNPLSVGRLAAVALSEYQGRFS